MHPSLLAAESGLDLVIAGGGLSGCLAALALAERRPDVSFLLLEQEERFGGNHVWSFFDSDVTPDDGWLLASLKVRHWPDHDVRFPARSRTIALGYNSVRSSDLDRLVRERLRPEQYRLGTQILGFEDGAVLLSGGERIEAKGLIDARGAGRLEGLDLAWQKFVGRTWRFASGHGRTRPVIMDARVDQSCGYRFVYTLPFSETDLLVEDTYYSQSPVLDAPLLRPRIDRYIEDDLPGRAALIGEETGVLPVALGGDVASLWTSPVAQLGLRGGFFHPTTGYSLPDAIRNAALLVRQSDLSTGALHHFYKAHSTSLWKERSFYRLLNRMLFRAAPPHQRYRILEHFYRLPEATIARFYAGETTLLDKARILSGKPPVPVARALAVMRERAI